MNKASELEGGRPQRARWLALVLVLAAPVAYAWNDTSHTIAALIAYDALPESTRVWALDVIRAHPRFREDFESRLPASIAEADAAERARWYFGRAAVWPDYARRFDDVAAPSRDELIARFGHGAWHYVNLPLYLRASDERFDAQPPPVLAWSADLDPSKLNIVQALAMLTATWCSRTAAERAVALSWVLHLMADLHQPLHTAAMFGAPAFLRGDRGGNDVPVAGANNLHAMWDTALGSERRWRRLEGAARADAAAITTRPNEVVVLDPARDFALWAADGRDVAARAAYTDDVRAAMAAAATNGMEPMTIDRAYKREMRAVSQRQIVLAGRRAAALLEQLHAIDQRSDCRR
jgi:hypothetical protein